MICSFERTSSTSIRNRLLHVAIEKFGQHGVEGVGTREIAAAADTAMSSITYHFGGKDGLYRAAAEHIFEHLQAAMFDPPIDLPAEDASDDERVVTICAFLRRAADFMLRDESAPFALFIAREQQAPSEVMRELMRKHMVMMMQAMAAQVAILRPDLAPEEVKATTLYFFGMCVTLRHARTSLLMLMDSDSITPKMRDMLLQRMESIVRSELTKDGS